MRILQIVVALPLLSWIGAALWFQFGGIARWILLFALAGLTVWLAVMWFGHRPIWRWLGLVTVLAGVWWATVRPSNDRNWQDEVTRGVTATIEGDIVTLHYVRRFEWREGAAYDARWEDRRYNLSDLRSVDIFTSNWGMQGISHTLIGFGFGDGGHVVFSGEIRKEKGEEFSSIAGFFRTYELVLVAADERDIVRVRTDIRGETVQIWRMRSTPAQRRAMFLGLVEMGNDLARHPRWYNTLITNCTTVIWQLARATDGRLPMDWRVILSGYLPDYLDDIGLIARGQTAETATLTPTTGSTAEGADYSRLLRQGTGLTTP